MSDLSSLLDKATLRALIDRTRTLPGDPASGELQVHYRADTPRGPLRHRQSFAGGRLTAWDLFDEASDGPEIVHQSTDASARFALGLLNGPQGCSATRIQVPMTDGPVQMLAPPEHLALAVGAAAGPRIPHADIVLQLSVRETPFGVLDYWMEFTEAQLTTWRWGRHMSPGVTLDPTLGQIVAFHSGEASLVDLIAGAQLDNVDWTFAMLAGGLIDSREFHAMWRGHWHPEVGVLMAALGRLRATEAFTQMRTTALELIAE